MLPCDLLFDSPTGAASTEKEDSALATTSHPSNTIEVLMELYEFWTGSPVGKQQWNRVVSKKMH